VRFAWESPPARKLFFPQKKIKSIGTLSVANRISHFAPNKKRPPICLFLFIFCFFVGVDCVLYSICWWRSDPFFIFLFIQLYTYIYTLTCLSYLFVCLDLALGAHVAPFTAGGVTVVCSASVAWASTLGGFGSLTVGGSAGSSGGWGIATATAD
jgi:hypothetical protein